MNAIVDMNTFRQKVTPVPAADQAIIDLSLRLMLSAALPPRIRHARTADPSDIELRKRQFELVTECYLDFVHAMLKELNSNLPITETVPTADFFDGMADLKSDMNWAFDHAIERDR